MHTSKNAALLLSIHFLYLVVQFLCIFHFYVCYPHIAIFTANIHNLPDQGATKGVTLGHVHHLIKKNYKSSAL